MTTITNFDITTDLKVEMYLPTDIFQPFILGVSLLGGHDVLDGDLNPSATWAWQSVEATVSECQISVGGSIESNLYFQPAPGTLSVKLQSYDYDPSYNSSIRAGAKIRVRLDDGTVNKTLFMGYIDTINVDYYPQGNKPNLINIRAFDVWKRFINTRASTLMFGNAVDQSNPKEVLQNVISQVNYTIATGSDMDNTLQVPWSGSPPPFDVLINSYILNAVQVGLGLIWVDQDTEEIHFTPRPTFSGAAVDVLHVGNDHGTPLHLCMSDIQVDADADAVFNNLKISNKDGSLSVVETDPGSIALYGVTSKDISLDIYGLESLGLFGKRVMEMASYGLGKIVRTVETPAINREGTLTEAAFFEPGDSLGVIYSRPPLDINQKYAITKVSHNIDVNNWFTTLELWRG